MSEENQTAPKAEQVKPNSVSRYETIRVPILRPVEYPIWKVKMTMFLEATDPEYLDRIYDGPHMPTKLSPVVDGQEQKTVPKEKKDMTPEDISSIAKDAKVRHLLHSALDNVMSNRVIGCKTAKEIWDALEVRCQGTGAIKKNRKTILTQEYEHFDSRPNETLTETYDRFCKLLNDLSLVNKEYELEESNLKFLLSLPEKWDLKTTTIRDNYELADTDLDEIYGLLKTHELEIEQRNGKIGINNRNNHLPTGAAPRKTCYNCGSSNHLARFCTKNKHINSLSSTSGVKNDYVRVKPQTLCTHCGSTWHSIYTCKSYHAIYHNYYELKPNLKWVKANSASVKSDNVSLNSVDSNSAAKANTVKKDKGSKQVWVLKTNT
ncbi:hypothetical protein POM88_049715 [Heracleum sosnowskyi]|uniref:CCHC-type domain-containing protein n=1 Tax=Heracleum sosnowskyi TaxID=360622 RepID=A0AAD8GYD0_9APIA|nr:hypothetical protein POM88_049715 [Heracleum sosnowskyi]